MSVSSPTMPFDKRHILRYEPPIWARNVLQHVPRGRLCLAHLPTPLYRLPPLKFIDKKYSNNDNNIKPSFSFWIKRDDMTGGLELGGNKIRKLEFLLANALEQQATAVLTIGGIQSNHCRATAAAARMIGLQPHLILRHPTSSSSSSSLPSSLIGNLLVNRMVGSHIYTCTSGEYGRIGSDELLLRVGRYVRDSLGESPYLIPVGGSNALGSWGYIQAVDELIEQWNTIDNNNDVKHHSNEELTTATTTLDHVVLACGSGGTVAGVFVGLILAHNFFQAQSANRLEVQSTTASKRGLLGATKPPHIHAIGVCDDPDYFYRHVADIVTNMGLDLPSLLHNNNMLDETYHSTLSHVVLTTSSESPSSLPSSSSIEDFIRQHMTVYQGKGRGYASSTEDELEFVAKFCHETGIVLDPVYTGKALYHFVTHVLYGRGDHSDADDDNGPSKKMFQDGSNILFWHTGGGLGLYDKINELLPVLMETTTPSQPSLSLVQRLDVYGKGDGIDVSQKS